MGNSAKLSWKAKDDEANDSKGSQSNGKKSVNLGAATLHVYGVKRSHRETLSEKNVTPSSSSGNWKSECHEKQTANLNSMSPLDKRKSELNEKQKNASPLRRSERDKMISLSCSLGSKGSDKSLDSLDMNRKKEKKEKSLKQLTMETVEVNKIEQEDGQVNEAKKKRRDARAFRALLRKNDKKVDGTDHCGDLNRTDSGQREEHLLEELAERTHGSTVVTSKSESVNVPLEKDNEHKTFPLSQKDGCKDVSSNGDGIQMNDNTEKAAPENLQSPQLVNSILHGGVLDCDINLEMVQEVMPSESKGHDIVIDSVASPIMSSKDICTSAAAEILSSSGCKRKDCCETCGTCSKRQRIECNSTKQEICSCNTKLNQFLGFSDIKGRGKLDVGFSKGHFEKPCNYMQQQVSTADRHTGSDRNTCIVCKLDGQLLCCSGKGCQRSYHLSCLESPFDELSLGVWYCLACVRKKLEEGVYSVSEGIEAIWDSRELEASEDGLGRQKQYFVKYKGLAHVHNRWVSENQLLLEAPSLAAKCNKKNQGAVWKQRWAVPNRVLQKRLLMIPKECDEHHHKGYDSDKLNCHVEWLVKWCGLGYEHASWELDNASFFNCPEGQRLIRDYETRRSKAKGASKFDKEREAASLKFSQLPAGVSSELDANLDAVNKLCNYWHRYQNAIIFDDQERIPNVISSILSFQSDISMPFLIISTSTSQFSWEEEFLHLAPSADVVVYSGSKEIRNSIRNLEFYEEGGCLMFQVLITSPEVIIEDLDVLDCIGWEAIIVDECQRPRIASCFEQIELLTASKRLLIISSQLKDNLAEYRKVLSLLDSGSNSNGSDCLIATSSDNIGTLKERLAKYVAYESKLESSRFAEYWVPVFLSDVQLEQYCFTLLKNSLSLCSPSKTDPVGALRSILISCRKCCDHPYVVDQSLQMLLTQGLKEVEVLDVGIKASGKLELLDAMLWEIKKRELKVLILFQSIGGSGRYLMGDILDDFLGQRFGPNSYERVDSGVMPSKKQSALNKFNNERETFVFLLETHSCLPSIKLSAVGTVIIFGSDWSPMNDLRALQRIKFDSQFEQIKIFRLYLSFTVEEKVLMLSEHDKTLDSNVENVSPSSSQMLLKWGASYLFSQLDKFHGIHASTLSEQSHIKDVIQEFFVILNQTGIDNDARKLSLILQAKQNQGIYRTEVPMFGIKKIQVMDEDLPHIFWTKLLEGKKPRWKYSSCSSQRNRKRVQYFDVLPKEAEAKSAEVVKRFKKVVTNGNDHPSPKAGLQEGKMAAEDREGRSGSSAYSLSPSLGRLTASGSDKIHATSISLHLANNISKIPAVNVVEWESRRKQLDSQKDLHVLLRPQTAKLCEVLHLSDNVKAMVERFLEYVMHNHLVNREPESILQAFQISLCWTAASLLKLKIDHKESLILAKQHLGFTCKKEEADYIYSILRCLKRMFLYCTGYLKVPNSPKASELSSKAVGSDYSNAASYPQNVKAEIEDLLGEEFSDKQAIPGSGVAPEFQLSQSDLLKNIKEIEKKRDKQMTKLIQKQSEEIKQFNQKYKEEKAQLENKKRIEAAFIRLHGNVSLRPDMLKNLDIVFARKFDELKQQMELHLKNLEALQVAAKSDLLESKTRWVEAVKSWARVELVKPPVSEVNISERRSSAGVIQSAPGSEERLFKKFYTAPSDPIDKAIPYKESSEGELVECNVTICSSGDEEPAVYKDSCPTEQVFVGETPDAGALGDVPVTSSDYFGQSVISVRCSDGGQISGESKLNMSNGDPEAVSHTDSPQNLVSVEAPSCQETLTGATLSKPNREVPVKEAESVSSYEGLENLASLQALSSEKNSDRHTLRKVDGEIPLIEPGTIISSEGRENLVSSKAPSCLEIYDQSNLSKVDGQVPLRETMIANSGEGQENLVLAEAASSDEILHGSALGKAVGDIQLLATKTVNSGGVENFVPLEAPSSGETPDGTTLSNVDGKVQLRAPETVSSGECWENLLSVVESPTEEIPGGRTILGLADGESCCGATEAVSSSEGQGYIMSANSSFEQVPGEATLNIPDEEVPKNTSEIATSSNDMDIDCTNPSLEAPETVCSGECRENFPLMVEPSSEEIPGGRTILSMADGESPCSATEVVNSCEGQGYIMSANSSFEKQVHGEATLNIPDEEVPKNTSEIATSSNDMDIDFMNPSISKEQIPGTAALSIPAEEVSLVEPESAPSKVLEGDSVHRENDGTNAIEIDKQDGIPCTTNQESEFQEPSQVSSNVGSLPYASSGIQTRDISNSETQNASQVAETSASYDAIEVNCNVSNPDTPVVEIRDQIPQLRCSESNSSLFSPHLPSLIPMEISIGGQTNQIYQDPWQLVADHVELSNVLQPLHSTAVSAVAEPVRQASETRTASVPPVSSNLPSQTAPGGSSQMPLPMYRDPLQIEMERIYKEKNQAITGHEETKLRLKSECEKEIEEVVSQIRRKYEVKLKEKEAEFMLNKKELDVNYTKVLLNKILAEAFRSKCMDNRASGSEGAQQEASFLRQMVQLSSQQMVQQPSTASGPHSTGSATSMQTALPAVVNAQTMGTPLQIVHPLAFFSGISSSTGTLQLGNEIRAPALHLHPFRPSASIFPNSLPSQSRVMSSRQAHNNHHVSFTSLLESYGNPLAQRQVSTTCESGRIQHEIAEGLETLPNSSLPSLDNVMGMNNLTGSNANPPNNLLPNVSSSMAASIKESELPSIPTNPALLTAPTGIVCLSDDD